MVVTGCYSAFLGRTPYQRAVSDAHNPHQTQGLDLLFCPFHDEAAVDNLLSPVCFHIKANDKAVFIIARVSVKSYV